MSTMDKITFTKSKIYERLDYKPKPEDYKNKVPWIVQNQIAATNGIHYVDCIGKLKEYPQYELPVPAVTGQKLMLDIGSGWGRWLISGANKGFIPIGMDIRLEFCETQQKVLRDFGIKGYSVVGDLENLPFIDSTFDLIWSFSVIQHTHYDRFTNCLKSINQCLTENGYTYLEFPNKDGLRNKRGPVLTQSKSKDDYNSWCVRYYTIQEYKEIFDDILKGFQFDNHSFLGIGVLKEDVKYVSLKNKVLCSASLLLSFLTRIIPGLKNYSDSVYIKAFKKGYTPENSNLKKFIDSHNSTNFDNLNIVPLLKCPKYGLSLKIDETRTKAIAEEAGIYYPIVNDIPILISSEANIL